MLKLSDNPPIMSPVIKAMSEGKGSWWVAHTKARAEKAFAADLLERDIAYFLPMFLRVTYSTGRKRRSMMPLFPGYVFFCGDKEVRHQALLTDRLCQVIEARDQQQFVGELSAIHQLLTSGRNMDPYPFAAVGRRCRIASGPLEGIEGTVIRREDGASRLVLQVSMLGQGAAVDIEPDLLEAIE